jgi:uncharacterized protein (TIGR02145 family)
LFLIIDAYEIGAKLKAVSGWKSAADNAYLGTDEFGFSALPGGLYDGSSAEFRSVSEEGYWWAVKQFSEKIGDTYYPRYGTGAIRVNDGPTVSSNMSEGIGSDYYASVRCVEDY